ncbi:MAG: choice-of-anchor D domain-containing protein [Acidobacteriaceae bacterium]|nr:choice-of-anchor D domain-containing protein [Acidobacteriaceae bacterium]
MKRLGLALLLFAASASAQGLSVKLFSANQATPLPNPYAFPDTPQYGLSTVTLEITNTNSSALTILDVWGSAAAGDSSQSPNFSVSAGIGIPFSLAPGQTRTFALNFTPAVTGALTGYLETAYLNGQNTCTPGQQCAASIATLATLQGNGLPPVWVLRYGSNNTPLQAASNTPLDFGSVSLSSTASITFVIKNQSSSALNTPSLSLQVPVFSSSAFQLDTSALPATIAAGGSADFTVTFAPGQTGLTQAMLNVGTLSYTLQGTGIVVSAIDALQVSYVDQSGVRTEPQAATPINSGQVIAGTSSSGTLTFTVTNPSTSFDAVNLASLAVSGSGFKLTGAPPLPASIQPGKNIQFQLTFSPAATGTYHGTLSIGTRTFSLIGRSTASPLPAISFQLSTSSLTSQQQVNLSIELAQPSPEAAIGDLKIQFTPSVPNVSDDPAVVFLATNTRELNVAVAQGSQSATYNSQSAIAFQTGTTAGTLALTLTFPDAAPYTQSFTISPAQIFISSAHAVVQSPNLVLTLDGYDNTYSAGDLSFLFYDTSGKPLTPSALNVNVASDFHQYFFTNNQAGGAFALQATFAVTSGDATKVGSVAVTLTNTAGQTTKTLSFN